MAGEAALEIHNLWKLYGREALGIDVNKPASLAKALQRGAVAAVRDVSFQVERGEVFVIMGLSGSGKSTLIRCLLRLIEPTGGSVRADGQDVTQMNQQQLREFRRQRVAMVFQQYGLLPHRTVLENVSFGLKLRGVKKRQREEAALEVIEKVGLAGWEKRYPSDLSGGMQQRVGIARALLQDPHLLLLDEPFSGLDPLIRRELQDELMRLQAEFQTTMLFVTHDLQEALLLGDRMAVMRDGTFVQVGEPREIVQQPADDYVRRFVQDERRMSQLANDSKDKAD